MLAIVLGIVIAAVLHQALMPAPAQGTRVIVTTGQREPRGGLLDAILLLALVTLVLILLV